MKDRRHGVGWHKREDDALREMFCTFAYSPKHIALELDRSPGAIRSRIKMLGLRPSSVKTAPIRRQLFKEIFR
jgi:hypothetical protein